MSINIIFGYGLAILTSVVIIWFFNKITQDNLTRGRSPFDK